MAVRVCPVSVLRAVRLAPGTTAPEASFTTPRIVAVGSCASANEANTPTPNKKHTTDFLPIRQTRSMASPSQSRVKTNAASRLIFDFSNSFSSVQLPSPSPTPENTEFYHCLWFLGTSRRQFLREGDVPFHGGISIAPVASASS